MPTTEAQAPPRPRVRRRARAGGGPAGALIGRSFRDARALTIVFTYLFAVYSFVQPVGYRRVYTTQASREAFAHSFATNPGLRLLYGEPHNVAAVAGYTAWRVGGVLAIAAAIFGVLAAVRALRGEEDAGRTELVLAGIVSRRTVYLAAMAAIGAATLILWAAEFAGFAVGGLPVGGAAYLALTTASVIPVFAGIGAVASQIAPSRRLAAEISGGAAGLFFLLRVIADTVAGAGWLRWVTPLGWAEEMRPFAGARPAVLLLPVVATALLLGVAARLGATRDVGSGLIRERTGASPRLWLLSSPTAQALRGQRDGLIAWAGSFVVFSFILGVVASSVSSSGIPASADSAFAKLGAGSILTPSGYLAFIFFFYVLGISLFACAQIGNARHEEASQQLETLLALPVGRTGWLAGRLLIAACACAVISLLSGLLTWAGATAGGTSVPVGQMLEAGANCLPAALLFLGIAALAYAAAPRVSAAIGYGVIVLTFLWQAVGALLGAPGWLVGLTPFAHIGLVPAAPFRAAAAVVMIGIGLAATVAALAVFRRRDLIPA
jgi:polyether ionophore transport system permease protein